MRRVLQVFLIFLPMAAVGTVSHELGHVTAARALGYDTVLHYGSTEFSRPAPDRARLFTTAAGPASTMALGTLGFLWLLLLRSRAPSEAPLEVHGWIATLLALFWSREVFNAIAFAVLPASSTTRGDEIVMAQVWGISGWITMILPGAIGAVICAAVIRLHPAGHRLALGIAGPAGCLAGFAIWYGSLGPRLLP